MDFDYYYGDESEQFSYFRIPRLLVTDEAFRRLSTDAKLLYGLLLDRMSLSARNGWYDGQGRVYIFYPLQEIKRDLNCGHEKAVKLIAELDSGKGCGLIERIKQGQGKPAIIYVKRFTTGQVPAQSPTPQGTPRLPIFGSQEVGKSEVKTSDIRKSRLRKSGSADFGKSDPNYLYLNQPKSSPLDVSIHPSPAPGWMDRSECEKAVWAQIHGDELCQRHTAAEVKEVAALIVDTLCTTRPTVRIGGEAIPAGQVRDRFQRLSWEHLDYVFECMSRNTTQVRNIRAYLLTALYNAPATISSYYQAEVQHDFA